MTFNEAVNVDTTGGRPSLMIDFWPAANTGEKAAVYKAGSGTRTLVFEYRVVSGNNSNGVAVLADSLALNGGSITTVHDGTAADLANPGLDYDPNHLVDHTQPARSRLVGNFNVASLPPGQRVVLSSRAQGAGVHHRARQERLHPHRRRREIVRQRSRDQYGRVHRDGPVPGAGPTAWLR